MSNIEKGKISRICYKITGTSAIVIIATLIDWWIFHLIPWPVQLLYFLGVVAFGSLFLGIIINIWEGWD